MATLSGTSSEDDVSFNKRKFGDIDENEAQLGSKKMRAFSSSSGSADSDEEELGRPSFGLASFSMGPSVELVGSVNNVASDFIVSEGKNKEVAYNEKAAQMMAKMGYKKGAGLGRFEQGIVNPVESSKHKGRRGLGMTPTGFEQTDVEWRFDREIVSAEESIEWVPSCHEPPPNSEEMITDWMKIGPVKMSINDEDEFCDPKVLSSVLSCKDVFDNLESEEMRKARTKSNPFETIRGVFFLNRAAMKMANMDAVADFMFTQPKDEQGKSLIQPGELLYFGDVCAGPGGFSEYVLWRRKCDTKGFGFTLKGACDFKLEDFFAAPSEYFEPHYGVQDDGDIYNPDNLRSFRQFVFENTENRGLHFVMADGGFSVDGQENLQEILSKRLYLCQFLCALSVLREGGHFVCKLFDLFTPFSVGLVYLMYRAFRNVSIFKPVTSRPANSERYIICKGRRPDSGMIHDYMFQINLKLEQLGSFNDVTVSQCVPLEVIKRDDVFFQYIFDSNVRIGTQQAIGLSKIQIFAKNNDLMEERQTEMRTECLKRWNVPDQLRTAPERSVPAHVKFAKLMGNKELHLKVDPTELTPLSLQSIRSVYNYRCVIAGSKDINDSGKPAERWFLLGLGKSFVFKWDGRPSSKWVKEDNLIIELPWDTILEVEYVQELRGEARAQRRVTCVHVIDAMFLGGIDVRTLHFSERHEKIKKFVKAITRPTRKDLAPIRIKDVYRLEEIASVFDRLAIKKMKGGGGRLKLGYCDVTGNSYIVPSGMYLIKTVQDPWSMEFSRSSQRKYFYNNADKTSVFECPKECIAPFRSCLKNRLLWSWSEVKVHEYQEINADPTKVSRDDMISFIEQRTGMRKYK